MICHLPCHPKSENELWYDELSHAVSTQSENDFTICYMSCQPKTKMTLWYDDAVTTQNKNEIAIRWAVTCRASPKRKSYCDAMRYHIPCQPKPKSESNIVADTMSCHMMFQPKVKIILWYDELSHVVSTQSENNADHIFTLFRVFVINCSGIHTIDTFHP